jgi:hypothetical protein
MTKKELKAMKSLRLNKDTRILQADKRNCTVVLDESKYKDKLNILPSPGFMNPCPKIPQLRLRGKYRNSFPNTKLFFLLMLSVS